MEISEKLVAIVIPIYRNSLDNFELASLSKCFGFWQEKFDIIFVKPDSLDISSIQSRFEASKVSSFDNSYFTNLSGYNRLMLSTEFYERFLGYQYIFIYQTDGYAFRDELEEWCKKGYDYIGAPWIPKERNNSSFYRHYVSARKSLHNLLRRPDRSGQYYQVGNGGVSLRRTGLFYSTTISDRGTIEKYIASLGKSSMDNEDIYWSLLLK